MKVLLVNKFFFMKGGAETVFFQEREFLQNSGVQVVDFSMQHEKNWQTDYDNFFVENVDYHEGHGLLSSLKTAWRFIHNSEACSQIKALIEQEKPDIVHFHNIYHQLTPSVIKVAKSLGCKTVLTAHDTKIACPNYNMYLNGKACEACLDSGVWNALKNRCQQGSLFKSALLSLEAVYQELTGNYRELDVIISPSEFLANIIRRKLPDSRIEVIVNGIDENVDRSEVGDDGYFLFLGRLSREKGVATMSKAYELSEKKLPLKVVGDGPLYEELKETCPSIEFLGFQTGETLQTLIRRCSAVIVPSEWYENCSMSVLEALAYGKPVIGSRIGGIPEQVRDGIEGMLFEAANPEALADAMNMFTRDPQRAVELGINARKRLESKYSMTRHQQSLLDLYHDIIIG